jgi:hypothetical protein
MKIDGIPWNFHKNHPAMGVLPIDRPLQGHRRSKESGPWAPQTHGDPGQGTLHATQRWMLRGIWGLELSFEKKVAVSWEKKGFDQENHGDFNRKSWGISNDLI